MQHDDYLYMNGSAIFNFTLDTIPQLINQVLEKEHLSIEQVDYYVFAEYDTENRRIAKREILCESGGDRKYGFFNCIDRIEGLYDE